MNQNKTFKAIDESFSFFFNHLSSDEYEQFKFTLCSNIIYNQSNTTRTSKEMKKIYIHQKGSVLNCPVITSGKRKC